MPNISAWESATHRNKTLSQIFTKAKFPCQQLRAAAPFELSPARWGGQEQPPAGLAAAASTSRLANPAPSPEGTSQIPEEPLRNPSITTTKNYGHSHPAPATYFVIKPRIFSPATQPSRWSPRRLRSSSREQPSPSPLQQTHVWLSSTLKTNSPRPFSGDLVKSRALISANDTDRLKGSD